LADLLAQSVLRLPLGRLALGGAESIQAVPRADVVSCVLAFERLDDLHRRADRAQPFGHVQGMFPARLVLVLDDPDVGAAEEAVELLLPLARAAWVAGCDNAGALKGVDVLLALGDPDRPALGYAGDELRQAVGHPAHAARRPAPA
jgi:hypothetical protein